MHLTKFSVRLMGLLAVIAGVVLAFSSAGPGAPRDVQADAGFILQDSLTCSDQYLLSVSKGKPSPDIFEGEPFRTGKTMTRTVVDKSTNEVIEVVQSTYLNPNISAEDVFAEPPISATTCQEEGDVDNSLSLEIKFTSPNPAKRGSGSEAGLPTLVKKFQEDGVVLLNDPDDPGLNACNDGIDNGRDQGIVLAGDIDDTTDPVSFQVDVNGASKVLVVNDEIRIDAEEFLVTAVVTDDGGPGIDLITADRAQNATALAAHSTGASPLKLDGADGADADGDCAAATVPALESFGCSISAATGEWGAVSVNTILDMSTIGLDLGEGKTRSVGVFYINIGAPPAGDARLCEEGGVDGAAATAEVAFGFTSEVHSRTITKGPPEALVLDDDWDGDGCSDWLELAPAPNNQGLDPFNPNDCPKGGVDLTGSYNILATAFPASKKGVITGELADVDSVKNKVIKDGKHVQVELNVTAPNDLTGGQKVYWEKWVYDPTNNEDGVVGTCDDGKDNGTDGPTDIDDADCHTDGDAGNAATYDPTLNEDGVATCADGQDNILFDGIDNDGENGIDDAGEADGADDADTDCYDLDPEQAGWWQVKLGGIGEPSGGTKTVTLNRLFTPPCGVGFTPEQLLEEPAALPLDPVNGRLRGFGCTGDFNLGNYFHCIARIDHAGDNTLDANLVCYIDAPLLTITGPTSAVPSFADGLAGAPPPPPYVPGHPNKLNGTYDKANNKIFLRGCFDNIGGSLGPNTVVEVNLDAKTLRGFANIWFAQSIKECAAKTPFGDPSLQLAVTLARQDIDFDHDGDDCTDYQELGHDKDPITVKKCGDDPYNPFDSDADANGVVSIQVTQIPADVCRNGASNQPGVSPDPCFGPDQAADGGDDLEDGTLVPGFYFHCIAKNVHDLGTNAITTTAYCYTDNAALTVNCEVVAGPPTGPCDVFASVCGDPPFAAASECGDGLPGSPPPAPFGDVDGSHPVGTGSYDKVTNIITTDTCFTGVESSIQGPNIYARTKVNIHTGQGTVQIATARDNCNKPDFSNEDPQTGGFLPVLIETAEQPPDWNSDLDGCTDAQELGQNQSAGGLRDPYNKWDFMDTWAGGQQPDKRIDGFDIGDVVARFGQVGTPGDPNVAPTAPDNYHVTADNASPLVGSNGWNLTPPDGRIDGFDIGFSVVQFGHTCA